MREIKFRAWDTKYNMMLPFDDLDLVLNSDGVFERHTKDYEGDYYCLTDQYIILQYTGLKDKNKAEIYRDDFVKTSHDTIFRVDWNKEKGQWYLYRGDEPSCALYHLLSVKDDVEVIGNIYDNPELMEEVKNEQR